MSESTKSEQLLMEGFDPPQEPEKGIGYATIYYGYCPHCDVLWNGWKKCPFCGYPEPKQLTLLEVNDVPE